MEKSSASPSNDNSARLWSDIFNLLQLIIIHFQEIFAACTCLTECSCPTTGNHSSAPHSPHWGISTSFKRKRIYFYLFFSSSKDANLKFRFCRHVSLHAIRSLLQNILFKITNRRNHVYNISSDTSFRRGEWWEVCRTKSVHAASSCHLYKSFSRGVHYAEH